MDYSSAFKTVLQDLIRVTHCHGCGEKYNVCFFGYVGEYCDKTCMKINDDNPYDSYDDEDKLPHSAIPCKWCDEQGISKANSLYHRSWYSSQNPSGYYWPMKSPKIPCNNSSIKDNDTFSIKGYNC